MSDLVPVRRALISVSEKAGLVPFAELLVRLGIEIVSSGSTAALLTEAGIPVRTVSDLTGFPEMLGGRVKTLHPKVHAAILADKRSDEHLRELDRAGIDPFDLVVVNLYPFQEAVRSGLPPEQVIEQIDVGGPAMVRAAAKNHASVGVVVDPAHYAEVAAEIRSQGGLSFETRRALALEAFAHTAGYDSAIAAWFGGSEGGLPEVLATVYSKRAELRYGENPHQRGALYAAGGGAGPLGGARVLQGKEMSFNNWLDAEAALSLVSDLGSPSVVIVKHHNPCGAARASSVADAYRAALESDRVSAFGGVVGVGGEVDGVTARAALEVFTEVVVAERFTQEALKVLGAKQNLRLVEAPPLDPGGLEVRPIAGGALVQDADRVTERREDMKVVTTRDPRAAEWADLLFAWLVAARVTSNAIVLASGEATVGVGAGQMSRVDAVDLACRKAGERAAGAAMASDAFFPFRDGIDRAAAAGVTTVIHPGGSVRDEEVIAAAEEHGMALVLTGRRHFRH